MVTCVASINCKSKLLQCGVRTALVGSNADFEKIVVVICPLDPVTSPATGSSLGVQYEECIPYY